MRDLEHIRGLAENALENARECPDCDDNDWDLNDALTPDVVLGMLDEREALRGALHRVARQQHDEGSFERHGRPGYSQSGWVRYQMVECRDPLCAEAWAALNPDPMVEP